jgi:lipopolysaccharide/colanic/teichoic acid biosynthesis glycosyltransferase
MWTEFRKPCWILRKSSAVEAELLGPAACGVGSVAEVQANQIENIAPVGVQSSFYQRHGKRALDILLAALGLVVLAPAFAACAVAVRVDSSGPILFRHERIGRNGKRFQTLKFRTMVNLQVPAARAITVAGDPRVTRSGRFLRAHKLDELPQLINVLRGDMSLVGPRPEVAKYVDCYTGIQRGVLSLRPGITGAASLATMDEEKELGAQQNPDDYYVRVLLPRKLDLDLRYAAAMSLRNDVTILAATVLRIFRS